MVPKLNGKYTRLRLKSEAKSDQMIFQKKNLQQENEHQRRSHIQTKELEFYVNVANDSKEWFL